MPDGNIVTAKSTTVAAFAAHALPTLDEVPSLPAGWHRLTRDFLELSLIPMDDVALREQAVRMFNAEERTANETMTGDSSNAYRQLKDLSGIPGRTPGGLAWKLMQVFNYFAGTEEERSWWYYLLESAVSDAIELERARQASKD